MENQIESSSIETLTFLPKDFFNKEVNEKFIKFVMESILQDGKWVKGDANKNEPDYLYNGIPLEFTLASDKCTRKKKENFITKIKTAHYSSENVEKDAIEYIEEQIKDKATKQYSLDNVHLCILCLLDRFDWISDIYGSCTHFLMDPKREEYFKEIKKKYIDTQKFSNIFIIFPDIFITWWVWDVKSNKRYPIPITDAMIESKKYPYIIEKNLYYKLVDKG